MTYMEGKGRQSASSAMDRPLPHLLALLVIGGLALLGCVVLAVWANLVDPNPYIVDTEAIELRAGLAAWADILLLVGVVCCVGATVIGGALEVGKRVVAEINRR